MFSSSFKEHMSRLERVFGRLNAAGLKLQPAKCHFARNSVKYLGHIVSARGIQPDPVKLQAVKNFPRPTEVKELKGFLGLAGYYRRFVPGFSQIAAPLFQLQEKGTDFVWTEASERAFTVLKERLTEPPVLAFPQFVNRST